jgi:hypothetical protein
MTNGGKLGREKPRKMLLVSSKIGILILKNVLSTVLS